MDEQWLLFDFKAFVVHSLKTKQTERNTKTKQTIIKTKQKTPILSMHMKAIVLLFPLTIIHAHLSGTGHWLLSSPVRNSLISKEPNLLLSKVFSKRRPKEEHLCALFV